MAAYAINDEKILNGLHSKISFDRLHTQTKKKPELSEDSGENNSDSVVESVKMGTSNSILAETPNSYKNYGGSVSKSRYIKLNHCEATLWLMANHPIAYLLLNLVAIRAQRTPNHPSGLKVGEAFIGDCEAIGATRQQYRTALDTLRRLNHLVVIETCRSRGDKKNSSTTVGTKVKLLNSDIWDINKEDTNHRILHLSTTGQPPTEQIVNHEQEVVINKLINNNSLSDSQAHQTKVPEKIFFDWNEMKIKGIESSDVDVWKKTFTHVDVVEYLKFIEQDIGAKPTKYRKRKQIVRTILTYFQNKNENIAAYKKNPRPGFQKTESLHNKQFNKDSSPKKYNNTYDFSKTGDL